MDWLEENNKDAMMLAGLELEALSADVLQLEGDLLADALANQGKVTDLFKRTSVADLVHTGHRLEERLH